MNNTSIYFEASQHLNFFFSRQIEYEPEIQRTIREYINPGDIVFDIGANIGQFSILFSRWVGPSGTIYAYEPDHRAHAFLTFNCNINGCKNIRTNNVGLGESEKELIFYSDSLTGGRKGSFIRKHTGTNYKGKKFRVKVSTLEVQIKEKGIPRFIKIDAEGFELDILKPIQNKLPKQTKFMIETRAETKHEVFEIFNRSNFICFLIGKKQKERISMSTEIPDFANLLFVCYA